MKTRLVVGLFSLAVLLAAVLFAAFNSAEVEREDLADATPQPLPAAPRAHSPVVTLPPSPPAPVLVQEFDGGGVPEVMAERWESIPLDPTGSSFGLDGERHNRFSPFNHALHAAARVEIMKCVGEMRRDQDHLLKMEMVIEATRAGYEVISTRLLGDAGVDAYTRRCLELAFEKQVEVPDAGVEPGKLFRVAYPISIWAKQTQ